MKQLLALLAEFLLFFLLDLLGGVFYHPFHIESRLAGARSFVWDGVFFMLLAWLLLMLAGAARKRLAASASHLSIALVLAALAAFLLKVGFVTHHW